MKILTSLVLCLVFVFTSFGQINDVNKAQTADEKQLIESGEKLSDLFTKRMLETGDVSPLVRDFFVSDFIERYIKEQKKQVSRANLNSQRVLFVSGMEYNADLLDKATADDWKRLYISTFNFIHFGLITTLNRIGKDFLQGKEPDDEAFNNLYPAKVVKLLDGDPILKNFIQKKDESNPINTVEEMRRVNDTLEKALILLNEGKNGKPSIEPSEDIQKLLPKMKEKNFGFQLGYDDSETFGFPKGTQFFDVRTALVINLIIVKVDGKSKIVWATPDLRD